MPLGPYAVGKTVPAPFNSRYANVNTALVGGAAAVYRDGVTTESTAGVTLTADFDGIVGLNVITIDTSADPSFYLAGSTYTIVLTAGTVGGESAAGVIVETFTLVTAAAAAAVVAAGTPGTVTVADLIRLALQRLRVLQAGAVPSAEDQADAFLLLNALVSSWALQPGTIQRVVRTTWTIVASQASYTVGTGGQIAIARPASPTAINAIAFQDTSQTPTMEYPGVAPWTEAEWASIPLKTYTSTYPQGWYYTPTVPLGTLTPWPIPTSTTLQGVIYVPTPIAQFAASTDTLVLPDGYELALVENLAVLLAPSFGVPLDPALVASARESKAWIRTRNVRMSELSTAGVVALFGGGGRANIYSGQE
jgi:hypothetical protein